MARESTSVFYFPIKSPEGAVTRHDQTSLEALDLWKHLQDHWCEHKPSATVNVKEDEWLSVGAWVYENFDSLSGIHFLQYDGGSYKQAPYPEFTPDESEYGIMTTPPHTIYWSSLSKS